MFTSNIIKQHLCCITESGREIVESIVVSNFISLQCILRGLNFDTSQGLMLNRIKTLLKIQKRSLHLSYNTSLKNPCSVLK